MCVFLLLFASMNFYSRSSRRTDERGRRTGENHLINNFNIFMEMACVRVMTTEHLSPTTQWRCGSLFYNILSFFAVFTLWTVVWICRRKLFAVVCLDANSMQSMHTEQRHARFDNNIVQLVRIGSCLVYKWHEEDYSCRFFFRRIRV